MARLACLGVCVDGRRHVRVLRGDSSRTESAAPTAIAEPSAMAYGLQSPSFSTPVRHKSSPSQDSEEKMLAWILLLLKQGGGAR